MPPRAKSTTPPRMTGEPLEPDEVDASGSVEVRLMRNVFIKKLLASAQVPQDGAHLGQWLRAVRLSRQLTPFHVGELFGLSGDDWLVIEAEARTREDLPAPLMDRIESIFRPPTATAPVRSPGEHALESQVQQLQAEVARLREQLSQVQEHVRAVASSEAVAGRKGAREREVKPGMYKRWIQQHMDQLTRHPGCHVAIDPTKGAEGLVLYAVDEDVFSRRLLEIYERDPSARRRLVLTHTSIYVEAGANTGSKGREVDP